MAQTVTLWGATYNNVPAIDVPSGNSTARFTDTSPTTATDPDVLSGKIYFKADGTQSTGTGSGGGGSSVAEAQIEGGVAIDSTSLQFTGLLGEPTSFVVWYDDPISVPSGTPYRTVVVVYDGTSHHGQTLTNTSNAQVTYNSSSYSHTYSNGTLTITSSSPVFISGAWFVSYTYGGTSGNIHTSDVQVGSGATSIAFTGLEDEPICWSLIFKSNFGTSSGYQRVIALRKREDGNGNVIIAGFAMDSQANISGQYWSENYNNGTLTITSQGTNAGGYFHQPGYYQLTYVIGDASPYQKISKTYTPTTSTQTEKIEASSGYEAIKEVNVTVNPIPSSYVQPTSTVGATTYRPSTSAQTIASGTYHSAQATIAAVSQTNLEAGNIKSGTTISISNGQSNLWSVTGTYTGGGSSDVVTGTLTVASNVNTSTSTQITTTSAIGFTPTKFFFYKDERTATSNHVHQATFTTIGSYYIRTMTRYSSNALSTSGNTNNWTTQTAGYLYYNSNTIYFRSSSSYILSSGTWHWVAVK